MHQVHDSKTVVTATYSETVQYFGSNHELKANPGLCMPCWHPHAVQLHVLQGCTVSISWQTLWSYRKTLLLKRKDKRPSFESKLIELMFQPRQALTLAILIPTSQDDWDDPNFFGRKLWATRKAQMKRIQAVVSGELFCSKFWRPSWELWAPSVKVHEVTRVTTVTAIHLWRSSSCHAPGKVAFSSSKFQRRLFDNETVNFRRAPENDEAIHASS